MIRKKEVAKQTLWVDGHQNWIAEVKEHYPDANIIQGTMALLDHNPPTLINPKGKIGQFDKSKNKGWVLAKVVAKKQDRLQRVISRLKR